MSSSIPTGKPNDDSLLLTMLPIEVRQAIYTEVFHHPHIALGAYSLVFKRIAAFNGSSSPVNDQNESKAKVEKRKRLSLLYVCKKVHDEAMQPFYATHVLRVFLSGSRATRLPMPTIGSFRHIQHLELHIVSEDNAACNYFQYLAKIENPKTCHVRLACGFPCQRMRPEFSCQQIGYNTPQLELMTGICAKLVTRLTTFLTRFQQVILSSGPLEKGKGDFEGCMHMWIGGNENILPPYHDDMLRNLSDVVKKADRANFEVTHMQNDRIKGDKAHRILLRRENAKVSSLPAFVEGHAECENEDGEDSVQDELIASKKMLSDELCGLFSALP